MSGISIGQSVLSVPFVFQDSWSSTVIVVYFFISPTMCPCIHLCIIVCFCLYCTFIFMGFLRTLMYWFFFFSWGVGGAWVESLLFERFSPSFGKRFFQRDWYSHIYIRRETVNILYNWLIPFKFISVLCSLLEKQQVFSYYGVCPFVRPLL